MLRVLFFVALASTTACHAVLGIVELTYAPEDGGARDGATRSGEPGDGGVGAALDTGTDARGTDAAPAALVAAPPSVDF